MALNLKEMTIDEKLKAMEMLWDDICRNSPDFSSPDWHREILEERQRKLKNGSDKFKDWDQAKKDVRNSIS